MEQVEKLLTKVFNKTPDELGEVLYEGEGEERKPREDWADSVIPLFEQKIQSIKSSTKEEKENFYKKGVKEKAQEFEQLFKDKIGYKGEKETFEEMLLDYAAQKPPKGMTEDDIKKHPLYIELEQSTIPKSKYEEAINSFEDYKKNVSRNEVLNKIKSKAWNIVEGHKPKMPENSTVAENLRNSFLSSFENFDYEFNGDQIIVLKDGKRVEDSLGNLVTFDTLTKQNADNWFEWNVTDARDASGNKNTPTGALPDSKEAFTKAFNETTDREARVKLGQYGRSKGWLI